MAPSSRCKDLKTWSAKRLPAFLNGGALAIPPTTASVELPLARANGRCCSRTLIAEGLLKPSEILGTMFIAADCLGMNTKEDAMDLNGKKIAILATNGFEQADSKCHGTG
jgi:hypothetical protein